MLLIPSKIIGPDQEPRECTLDCDSGACYINAGDDRTIFITPDGRTILLDHEYRKFMADLIDQARGDDE